MNPRQVIVYDGECIFCNKFILWLYRADKRGKFFFTNSTSITAQKISSTFPTQFKKLDSVVFVSGNKKYFKSDAVLHILRELGSGWKLLYGFIIVPRVLRNIAYDFVAKNRYRLFGKSQHCIIPDKLFAKRMLL